MEYQALKERLSQIKKGTVHNITYAKELKTRKGVTDNIVKITTVQGRLGCEYDNLATVKEARENGTLPTENQGLPANTEWAERPYLIKSNKTGKLQLRVTRFDGNKSEVIYLKNNIPVQKADVEGLCLKSEFPTYKEGQTAPPIFNVAIDKIVRIK